MTVNCALPRMTGRSREAGAIPRNPIPIVLNVYEKIYGNDHGRKVEMGFRLVKTITIPMERVRLIEQRFPVYIW